MVVSYETILSVISKISVAKNECLLMCRPTKRRSQYGFYFYEWACKTALSR